MNRIYCKAKLRTGNVGNFLEDYFNGGTKTTYTKNNQLQCLKNRDRSFVDLWKMCRTYFPSVKKSVVAKALDKLGKEGKIGCVWCGRVRKITFWSISKGYSNFFKGDHPEGFRNKKEKTDIHDVENWNKFQKLLKQ